MPNIVSTTSSKFLDELVDKSLNTRADGALKLPEYQPPKEWTKESSTIQTPQKSGGSVSNAPKKQGVDVSESRVPLSHRNRKAFDWLETANTTISPTALNKPSSYESKRLTDTNSNFGMGGREVKLSGKEYTTAPRAAATGALEATEGMLKAPSVFMADYYKYGKDTYESKRESESTGRAQEQRAQRSAEYKKENQAENDKKAQEWADKATSIDLYKEGTFLRDYINETKEAMQSLKEETEQDFTLADMAYTIGQMAPSIALGQAGGFAAGKLLSGTNLGQAMAANFATNEALTNIGNLPEAAYDISKALEVARGLQTASAIKEASTIGSTVGSIGSMYAQVYGNSFDEAIANGATLEEALNTAKSHAMIESATELIGGGIPGMGGGVGTKFITNMADKTAAKFGGKGVEALLPKALSTVASVLSSPTGEMALDIIGEGVEEMISEAYEPLIASKDGNANWSDLVNWGDVALAGFRGSLVSAVMQGGMAILQSGARDGIAYQYDEDTGRIKKVGPEGITQQVETAEGSAESSAAADAGVTEAETKDSVVPQNVSEAVAKGAPSVNEAVDQTNRRTASRFLNSFVTSATPSSKAVFREGGALAERYREKFGDDYKALDAYKARQSRIDETLPLDATWEQIYDFFDRVVVPEIQAYTRYAEEQTAKNDYDYALENPNLEGIMPESLPADYVESYKQANGLEMMPDAEVRQRIVDSLAAMGAEDRLDEITKFSKEAGISLEDVYGDGFLDLWSSQLQQDRALDLREQHNGRVKVDGLGVVGADEFFDYAAQKRYGADNFDVLDDEQKAEIVDLFERAVADEQTKMKEFADSLNELGKPTGLKVVFDPELEDETGSAYDRKTSTIRINPNTVSTYQAMRFFVAHELVHHAMNLFKGKPKQLAAFRQKLDDMAASVGVDIEQERGYWKEQRHYKEQWKYEEEPYARFLSELLGSYEMLIELAQNNPTALYDLIGYVDNASKVRKTTNKEVKRAEAAIKSDLKAAKNKTLEKKAAKENAKIMKDIPEDVQETSKMSDGVNTVKEAQKIDDSKAPSESMEEARAKVEAANAAEKKAPEVGASLGIKTGNLSDHHRKLVEDYLRLVVNYNGAETMPYEEYYDSLSPADKALLDAFEYFVSDYAESEDFSNASFAEFLYPSDPKAYKEYNPKAKKTTKKGTTKKTATEEAFTPKSETVAEQTTREDVATEAVEPETTEERAEPKKEEPTATEEAFTPKSEQPVEMPEKAKEMGFQRVDGKSQITFQQAVAGEGKSRRQRLEKEGEARQTEELDLNKPITIPSLPNVSFQVISHVPLGGTANGEPILTIRAIPDDSHGMSSKGGHRLLKDWEIRLVKQLGFSSPKRNGIYEHDFTREFWLSLQNAETDGILDKSTKTDDNDMFFEYTGIGEEDGARFQIVPKLNQKGEYEGEEIRLLFRDEKGNRKAADPNVKNTFKDTYQFKYDKYNPHGSGFYVPFTDEMAARLGLPAMTKKMRENNNLSYRRHMALLKGVATVPIADESFNGLDLGYNPSNRTLYLCKDGKAVFSLPYNEAVVNELLAQESDRTDVFREMSEDQQYLNDLTSGLQERNRERRFDNITATEEAERNEAAERLNQEKPINKEAEETIAKQNARYAKDPNMVKVKYRDNPDPVWLPKKFLRQMTTLAITWKKNAKGERTGEIERLNLAGRSEKSGHLGEMWDELYLAKGEDGRVLTPDEIRINPATGRQRALTAYEIPEKIWTNKDDLVWDATDYDENAVDPGSTLTGVNWNWFKSEFEKLYGKNHNDNVDEQDEYVKAKKKAEEEEAKAKTKKRLTKSGARGTITSTYSQAELDEMNEIDSNFNAAAKSKKRQAVLDKETEDYQNTRTDYTPEELEMLHAQEDAAAEAYAEQQAAYEDYLGGIEDTIKEETEEKNKRRGWANQDWFFNTFNKEKGKSKAQTEYEAAKDEERVRYKEDREYVERLARENAGEYESMDLLSVSPDRLVNEIYRGKNGRAKLLELLDLEVAKSTAADRFDEAAQFEYLKRTIEELDRAMTYTEDREAARGGTPEQRATIYDNTQKRLNILAKAYAEESAAAEDVKELAKLDDKENTKANVKKAKKLQKSIEEHNNKADEYKAEAAKIAEAIGKLRAQIEQEFLKQYPDEAKTPVETKAKTGKAAKDAERFDLGSQRLALEKELALAKAEIEKVTNRLNEEQQVEWSNDKNFPDKYRYASNNTLKEIQQLRDKIDRYDKAAEQREKKKKFWDKYIEDKKAEIASLEKGVKPAPKKKAGDGTIPEASNTKVTEDDVKKARNELAEAENTRKSLDNVSESERKDRAEYYRLTQAFTEARWKEAKDREIKRLKSDVKTAQARADEVRAELAKVDSKLEKLTTKKITLDEILMGVEAAENDAMGVPEAVEAEREADNTLPYEEDEMLDVRPIPSRLKDTANRNLSTIQDEFYRSKPGSLNNEGVVQEYSTTYEEMPEEFGDGAYWLYIEGAVPEEEATPNGTESGLAAEKVYAALENPMYPSEPAAAEYDSLVSAMQSLAEDFGLVEGNYVPNVTSGEQTIIDAVHTTAENIVKANPDRIDLGTAINELVTLMGYDGILFMDGAVVFDQNNIKSVSDPDPANSTIGFSITDDMINNMGKKSEAKRKILNNPEIERQWRLAQEKHGTIGNTPIPQKVYNGKKKVSTWNETAYELPNISVKDTPLESAQKDAILANMASYTVKTDSATLAKVKKWMTDMGFEKDGVITKDAFANMYNFIMRNGINSKEDVFRAGQVLTEMSNFARMYPDQVTDKMAEAWQYLYAKMSVTASKTGQILQAFSALRKLTPQGRLYYIQNVIEELRKELHERKGIGSNKIRNALDSYEIDPALIKEMNEVDFNDKAKVADIEARIAADIAKQIPATVASRVRAYRYLCMLGSIRTHARNTASNALMVAAKEGARFWSGLGQDIFVKEENKTTTLKRATEDQKAFAKKDSLLNEEALQYGGKRGFDTLINQYRKNFGNSPAGKFLERLSAFNGNMLEKEDLIFLNREYRRSLSKYMAAHNFTSAYFESNTAQALEDLNKAREYALNQAWDATYRQANIVADALNSVEKKSPLASIIIEGLVPFKRTPMNIIIQGAHYSPIGILEGLGKFERMLAKGDITGAEVADRLGQGLTGTGILLLGLALGSMGVARASGDESDREEYYDQMLGEQKYSLRIGGHSYTIDWLTPISMPLMSGVELAELGKKKALMEDDDDDFNEWFNRLVTAISTMADPVTNLSMLQSINDVLSAYKDNQIGNLLMNAGQSYALQFVPTFSGQSLRTIDPTRRTTYAPSDSDYPFGKFGETFVNKLKNKSLIANAVLGDNNEYVDQWGRTETGEEDPILRAFNQYIAPWYMRDFNSTAVDDKLAEVFAENGKNTAVLPATPQSNFSIGGTNYKLSGDEYEKVKKVVGNLSYRGLENAFASDIFNGMSADEQTNVIKNIYSYARQMAKIDYASKKGLQVWMSKKEQEAYLEDHPNAKGFVQESYVADIATLEKYGYGAGDYFAIVNSISGLKKKQKERALRDMGLPYDVRQVFL